VSTIYTDAKIPRIIFSKSNIEVSESDIVLANGVMIDIDTEAQGYPLTLEIRHSSIFSFETSSGLQEITSPDFTLGEAISNINITPTKGETYSLDLNTKITPGITLSRSIQIPTQIYNDGKVLSTQSKAATVGQALSDSGIILNGLDYSIPSEKEAVPANGQINVIRVSESIVLAQKPIPFNNEFVASFDVPIDQTQLLIPGVNGLSIQRVRVRYENGSEVSRIKEDESIIRQPQTRTVGYGTKIEIKSEVVNGVQIEYWRAVQMYATSYSPCRSGADRCYTGTSSGKSLAKGMVALKYSWYLAMGGQALFIPGYGFATVEDVCGGCVGKPWIDLGYSDDNYEPWSSWVTVYFLAPPPQNIIYILE